MKSKRAVVALSSLCLLAAVTLIGFYSTGNSGKENYVDLAKDETPEITVAENAKEKKTEQPQTNQSEEKKETAGAKVQAKNFKNDNLDLDADVEAPLEPAPVTNKIANLSFTEEDSLEWPVEGKVLMSYSMDKTVYFKTLEQYKYNPAVIIAGEVNSEVFAAARGRVVEISENEETGNTITIDIGNDYSLTYGQLKEIPLTVGSIVEKGEVVGYIGETTKYYSEEGSNLYFAMKQNTTPKNPMDFMGTEGEE